MNQQERDEYIELGYTEKGWLPLIKELDRELSALDSDYGIVQIKEKFGGLRFYFEPSSDCSAEVADAMFELEHKYERESYLRCELCGSREDVETSGHGGYWIKTLCLECVNKEKT
jgi:hypothetical protein